MKTTFRSTICCTRCAKRATLHLADESLREAATLEEVAPLIEVSLRNRGWAFMGAEVESRDGGIEFMAGIWCDTCCGRLLDYMNRLC